MIGDQAVGKTSILGRITGKNFEENNYDATVGVEFGNYLVSIKQNDLKLQIWDTAGTECFRSITRIFYRNALLVMIGFDVTQ